MPGKALILIADDDQNDVFFLQRAFRKEGLEHALVHVSDGQEAIEFLADRATQPDHGIPDLLLLDLKMPKMTGFEVLSWLQSHPKLDKLPVVVLSGSNQPRDIEQARSLGAADYFVKPVEFDELLKFVRELNARWLTTHAQATMAG